MLQLALHSPLVISINEIVKRARGGHCAGQLQGWHHVSGTLQLRRQLHSQMKQTQTGSHCHQPGLRQIFIVRQPPLIYQEIVSRLKTIACRSLWAEPAILPTNSCSQTWIWCPWQRWLRSSRPMAILLRQIWTEIGINRRPANFPAIQYGLLHAGWASLWDDCWHPTPARHWWVYHTS